MTMQQIISISQNDFQKCVSIYLGHIDFHSFIERWKIINLTHILMDLKGPQYTQNTKVQ